nr:MAG TPA: hypothetical protein [Caudoviricetes sp.]
MGKFAILGRFGLLPIPAYTRKRKTQEIANLSV